MNPLSLPFNFSGLLILITLHVQSSNGLDLDANCTNSLARMDAIYSEALFIAKEAKFPSNEAEIEVYCRNGKLFTGEIRDFVGCTGPFPRQVLQVMGKSLAKVMKSMCKRGEPRQELAAAFRCATGEFSDSLRDCQRILVSQMYSASRNMTTEKLFPVICCSFHSMMDCIRAVPTPKCSGNLDLNAYAGDKINRMTREMLDLICGRWATVAQCIEVAPEVSEHIARIKSQRLFSSSESLLGNIMDIISKLSDK